jgi:sec-independent protein translocase protein TatB
MAHLSGGVVALLDTLTFPETITILVIALVVLGPEKLPGMAKSIGEWMHKLKKMSANLQAEVREVMDDPAMQPLRELGEFAAQPKKKIAEYALAAEAEVDRADAAAKADSSDPDPSDDGAAAPDHPAQDNATAQDLATAQDIESVEAEIDEAEAVENAIIAAEVGGPVDPEPIVTPPFEKKVVATGPDHPMERQTPAPHALDS